MTTRSPPVSLIERPFPRPQTPQNPADIDGPAGCVSLVDDARAKPAATTGQDDAEDEDEDDAGVPFPPLPTPRRSTALLSTRAVLHPNHRPEVVARDIAWSPLGLAPASSDESSGDDVLGGGGCLLAIASGSHHVTVHAPPTSQSNAEWRKVLDISEMFVSAAESHGWLECGGGDELDLRARFESNESNKFDAPKSLVSLETQLLRAREAPASLPPATAASNGTGGGTTVPRPSLPAAKGVETSAAPTEDVPADSLRVGAAVEVRASSSNTADGGAGGWRPGVIESLISAFNFRVRVRLAEPARGERGDLWLTIENPSEFPSLRLDHVGCHEFPSQSLVYQGASGTYGLRPAQPAPSRGKKGQKSIEGDAEVALARRGGWVPAVIEKGGVRVKLGAKGEGERYEMELGTIRVRRRMAWSGEGCSHGAWREAAAGDYAGYELSDFTFPRNEDKEDTEEETETTPVAAKPEPTVANVTLPKQQTEIVEKEELPDAAPAAAAAPAKRGRSKNVYFLAPYDDELQTRAKEDASKACEGCDDDHVKASEKAVEAVFKTAKIGDDVFDAANDASKEAKSRRNAALKDIALRIADAFIAARIGAGCAKTYPQSKHMDGTDKKCFEEVKKLAWKDYVAKGLKNNKKLEKELAQPIRNGYQAVIRKKEKNDPTTTVDRDDVPIARQARAARARSTTLSVDVDEDDDDEEFSDPGNSDDDEEEEDDEDEPKPKKHKRGRKSTITGVVSADPVSAIDAVRRAAAAAALSVAWSPRLGRSDADEAAASVLAVGCKSGAVTLWLVRRADDGVDTRAIGRVRVCDGWVNSLTWAGNARRGFALVVGGSDGSVRTFTASPDDLIAAAERSSKPVPDASKKTAPAKKRKGDEGVALAPLEPGVELSPADGDAVTRVSTSASVKIADDRAHVRPVIAAGRASGACSAWRLQSSDPRGFRSPAEASWCVRSRCQPVSGLAWCAAPEVQNGAAVRLVTLHTTGTTVMFTVPTDPKAPNDDWTLNEACVETSNVAGGRGGSTSNGGSIAVVAHGGLASSPAGVLVATAAGYVSSANARGAMSIQARARRGRVVVAPPGALAGRPGRGGSMSSGEGACPEEDDTDESYAVACAARRLPFLAPRGVSLWDVRAAAKHAGVAGERALEAAAVVMADGGDQELQLAGALLSKGPGAFAGFEPLSCEGCGTGYQRVREGWPGCTRCGLLLRPEDVTRAALSRAMV